MEKFKIIFKLALNFFKKYWIDYIALMIVPILLMIASFVLFVIIVIVGALLTNQLAPLMQQVLSKSAMANPDLNSQVVVVFLVGFLVSFLLFAYAFWKSCFISYSLNHAVYNFAKEKEAKPLEVYLNEIKRDEKGLLIFLLKSSLIALVPVLFIAAYLFAVVFLRVSNEQIFNTLPVVQLTVLLLFISSFAWVILLIPYFMFMFQAYYYRENEKCFAIFADCYKNLDSSVGLILLFSIVAQLIIGVLNVPLISSIASIFVSMFVFVLTSFWFFVKKFKIKDCECLIALETDKTE